MELKYYILAIFILLLVGYIAYLLFDKHGEWMPFRAPSKPYPTQKIQIYSCMGCGNMLKQPVEIYPSEVLICVECREHERWFDIKKDKNVPENMVIMGGVKMASIPQPPTPPKARTIKGPVKR